MTQNTRMCPGHRPESRPGFRAAAGRHRPFRVRRVVDRERKPAGGRGHQQKFRPEFRAAAGTHATAGARRMPTSKIRLRPARRRLVQDVPVRHRARPQAVQTQGVPQMFPVWEQAPRRVQMRRDARAQRKVICSEKVPSGTLQRDKQALQNVKMLQHEQLSIINSVYRK